MASTLRIALRNGGVGGPKATKLTAEEAIGEEMAMRKAEEAASRRFEAVEWLRKMDRGAVDIPLGEPSEEEFCLALRNGLILCNVLNKVNPGAIPKVVENPVVAVQLADGTAQSAIQYFENMRNFLVAVNEMKLLTFEASDIEKGGSSFKVVDCILCLKAYHEWKLAGEIGIWRYGGIVKISSSHRGFPSSLFNGATADESSDKSDMIHDHQLLDVLHLLSEVFLKDFKVTNFLSSFDHFGVRLLETLLIECADAGEFSLNDTLIDMVLEQAVKEFSALLVTRKNQLSVVMKKTMGENNKAISKATFFEVISKHLEEYGNNSPSYHATSSDASNLDVVDFQHKQLEKLKSSFNDLKAQVKRDHAKWEEDLRNFQLYMQGLELNTSSYYKLIEENRFLYNEVQDLKGCIRVYCRVRPTLINISDERSTIDYIGENGSIIIKNPHKQGRDARKIFSFNRVFGMNSTQAEVFADTKSLIRSVIDGYNVCIFAYGQTGSGKTYTMSGANLSVAETWGVSYRSLNYLFDISKSRTSIVNYDVSVQMVEIYNEQVRDLLVTDGCMRRLDIRNNSQLNGLNIPDAKLVAVTCTQDVLDLMKAGLANRSVGATALNERSSRSHSVLTIHVKGKELASGSILKGCLHLVDLAGSERVEKSEVTGERLKEAQHINRSLSALGDVISALAQKSSHIPYRNSKLTQVLQDSLGGQAKTLMLVHINPEINAFGETISTLKFAERVSSVELGAARVNKETGELRELKEEVSTLKSKLESKEMEVQKLKEYASLADSEMHNNRAISPSNSQNCNFILRNESIQRALSNPGVVE
ncbi:kinesin-like protein KIN-14F [Dendrobium catenatum]|uniref:kinesin-like protein KIN-14F n=1 Tax=Dendrobium catenatum TaxID=906689 RepID=UPI0009F6B551|nr:kinesin-like protein KIN-14F [Dendrobium catenatum]